MLTGFDFLFGFPSGFAASLRVPVVRQQGTAVRMNGGRELYSSFAFSLISAVYRLNIISTGIGQLMQIQAESRRWAGNAMLNGARGSRLILRVIPYDLVSIVLRPTARTGR